MAISINTYSKPQSMTRFMLGVAAHCGPDRGGIFRQDPLARRTCGS